MSNVIPRYSEGNKVEFTDKVSIWLNRAASFFSKDSRPVTPTDFRATALSGALLLTWTPTIGADYYNIYVSSTNDVNAKELLVRLYGNTGTFSHYIGSAVTRYYWLEANTNTGRVGELVQTSGTATAGGGGDSTHTSAYASRPSPSNAGDLFLPSDGFVVERDNGSAWVPWGPIFPFTAPVDGDFSWVNQGSASVSTTNGGICLNVPATASGVDAKCRVKSAPSTPYTITAAFLIGFVGKNAVNLCGLCFRESGTGELHAFGPGYHTSIVGGYYILSAKYNSATSFNANYSADSFSQFGPIVWLQISDDGTNRICRFSADGQNFIDYHSVGRTDFLTADQVGFLGDANNSVAAKVTLLSWKQS